MLKQIKQLVDDGKFQESLDMSMKILQKDPNNKSGLYLVASSFAGLGKIHDAQNSLNHLYSLLTKPQAGQPSQDDQLYFQALLVQRKIAICIQQQANGNTKMLQEGINCQIENQFQILDYLDKKGNYVQMLEEISTYVVLCMEANAMHLIEETYIWLFQHHALSADIQLRYGCLIFHIDKFYRPKTPIEQHFAKIAKLHQEVLGLKLKLEKDDIENLVGLAKQLMVYIDKQTWKKDIYTAIQAVTQNPNAVTEYKRYVENLIAAGDIYYHYCTEITYIKSDSAMNEYARYICAKAVTTPLYSQEWNAFIKLVESEVNNELHANTYGDLDANPIQLLLHAILDVNQVLQSGQLPTSKDHWFFEMITRDCRQRAIEWLEKFSESYSKMSPFVNLYYALSLSLQPSEVRDRVDNQSLFRKLEQADFLTRKILFFKLVNKKQPSDVSIILLCLKMQAIQGFPDAEKEENRVKIEQAYEKQNQFASKKFVSLYLSQVNEFRWMTLCDEGKWQDASLVLESLAQLDDSKCRAAKFNKAWVLFSFSNDMTNGPVSKRKLHRKIFEEISGLTADENLAASVLVFQGYISFLEGFDESPLDLWLEALKKDQTKPEIFYCLAIWYWFKLGDSEKARKCAEKALLLKPDFEQALLLMFDLLSEAGDKDKEALEFLNRCLSVNNHIGSAHYLKGLMLKNQGNYTQAIENLQNATKFYSLDHQRKRQAGLKQRYPQLHEVQDLTGRHLSLFQSKLGMFGLHPNLCVQAWILLTECFSRIDKPVVTLKCFQKSMEEIAVVLNKAIQLKYEPMRVQESEAAKLTGATVELIASVQSFTQYTYDKQNETVQTTIDLIQQLIRDKNAPDMLEECIDCLLIGAKIVTLNELAIKLALLALQIMQMSKCQRIWQLLEVALHNVLVKQVMIIDKAPVKVYGHVLQVTDDSKQVVAVKKLVSIVLSQKKFADSLNLQKAVQTALLQISQKTFNLEEKKKILIDLYKRATWLKERFVPDGATNIGPARREVVVDAAKIAHACSLNGIQLDSVDFAQEKIKLTRKAIMLEPLDARLWIMLSDFLQDDNPMKAQAIFKAYELDHESESIQSALIKHYLRSRSNYQKAFRVIVKSYQFSINKNKPINPIVTATLALLNAKSCFLDKKLSLKEQRSHLLESLSLIEQIDKEELVAMFSDLKCFLLHQKGDYLESIKFLTYATASHKQIDGVIRLMLLQAYMGSQYIGFNQVKQEYQKFAESESLSEHEESIKQQLQFIFDIENVPVQALKTETEQAIMKFASDADTACSLASKLILLQEVCLKLNILPDVNLLDQKDIVGLCDSLDPTQERMLFTQALRLLHRRDGKILEETKDNAELSEAKNYTKFLNQFSRHSNPVLPHITPAQNKALFRLYLQMKPELEESHTLKMHASQSIDAKDHKLKGLEQMIGKLKTDLLYAQREVMRSPLCLQANINWVWSLFYKGQAQSAVNAFVLLKQKVESGLIQNDKPDEFEKLAKFETLFTTPKKPVQASKLDLIAQICKQVETARNNQEVPDDLFRQTTDNVAIGLVKNLVSHDVEMWPQLLNDTFYMLKVFIFDQRQLTLFNAVIARMLQVIVSLLSPQAFASQEFKGQSNKDTPLFVLINEIWIFKCLHTASALTELKKFAGCDVECNQLEKVLNTGYFRRSPLPAQLLKARAFTMVKNFQKSNDLLEMTQDHDLLERDFIVALAHYAQQAYKQFYLSVIGLVAACKTTVEKQQKIACEARRLSHFNLAYAYYLKAFAESTFLAARKQGLTLQEDFKGEVDADDYKEAYFHRKANESLSKCATQLTHAGDQDGLLMRVVKAMQHEINN